LSLDKVENQMALFKVFGNDVLISCAWGKFTNDISKTSFVLQKVWNDLLPVDWLVTSWAGGGMMQTACWLTPRGLIEKAGLWDETLKSNQKFIVTKPDGKKVNIHTNEGLNSMLKSGFIHEDSLVQISSSTNNSSVMK
jgi:hypothetical protein